LTSSSSCASRIPIAFRDRARAAVEEFVMFQVRTSVIIVPSTEARSILGVQVRAAALAAWREIARRGAGLEMTHFQILFEGVTLAICSRIRRDGLIEIEMEIGDPKQAARVIPAADLRRAEARLSGRSSRPGRWG